MCAEDLLAAGASCIPLFLATCIAEGLINNVGCVECVTESSDFEKPAERGFKSGVAL